jgi:purine-binding chemotaxis protein CheW
MNNTKISQTSQFLFFKLEDEVYAINSFNVLEVVDFKPIRKVPQTNPCIKGITNIRGELVAVVDPKIRLGNKAGKIKKKTSFIIIKIFDSSKEKNVSIALMVDLILEVNEVSNSEVLDAPEFGTKLEKRFIKNIIKYKNDFVSILKISVVLDINELSKRG